MAGLAREFAEPVGLAADAELVGLLHDFGKYRDEFQPYLRGQRPGGSETQHAAYGAAWALVEGRQLLLSALAVAGLTLDCMISVTCKAYRNDRI